MTALAERTWISRAWELGQELQDARSVLLDVVHALYEAQHSIRVLGLACIYLCGGAGEPRDLAAERQAIAYLACGLLSIEDVRDLDWAPEHEGLVGAIDGEDAPRRFLDGPSRWLERVAMMSFRGPDGRLASRGESPRRRQRALVQAVLRLDAAPPQEAVVQRLRVLQRQRLALAAAVRAVRALRSTDCDHGAARAHLDDAIRMLEG